MQDDSSQADSWPQQQQQQQHDAAVGHVDVTMSHHGDGAMSRDDGGVTRELPSNGDLQAPQQQQQQQQPTVGAHAEQWVSHPPDSGQPSAAQQEGGLSRSSLDAQLRSSEMTSMQSDEILMHAAGDVPIPGGMTANPMYNVQGAR